MPWRVGRKANDVRGVEVEAPDEAGALPVTQHPQNTWGWRTREQVGAVRPCASRLGLYHQHGPLGALLAARPPRGVFLPRQAEGTFP
jgi:hypothetical protein